MLGWPLITHWDWSPTYSCLDYLDNNNGFIVGAVKSLGKVQNNNVKCKCVNKQVRNRDHPHAKKFHPNKNLEAECGAKIMKNWSEWCARRAIDRLKWTTITGRCDWRKSKKLNPSPTHCRSIRIRKKCSMHVKCKLTEPIDLFFWKVKLSERSEKRKSPVHCQVVYGGSKEKWGEQKVEGSGQWDWMTIRFNCGHTYRFRNGKGDLMLGGLAVIVRAGREGEGQLLTTEIDYCIVLSTWTKEKAHYHARGWFKYEGGVKGHFSQAGIIIIKNYTPSWRYS